MARPLIRPHGLLVFLIAVALGLFALASSQASAAPGNPPPGGPTAVVVRLKPGASLGDLAATLSPRGMTHDKAIGRAGLVRVKVPAGASAADLLAALRVNPAVSGAGFDLQVKAFDIPNDPAYASQWHMQPGAGGIDAPGAWALSPSRGAGVTVAVIDTGVAYEAHTGGQALFGPKVFAQAPDLANVPIVAPWDWIDGDSHAGDEHGHGTHVSGTVLQGSNNGVSGTGVSAASLMPLRILDFSGNGSGSDLIDALYYAADNGADVINLSLGFSGTGSPNASGQVCTEIIGLAEALDYAYAMGVTVVAASGNDGAGTVACPAAYPTVIAVGATGYAGTVTSYSNRGTALSVAAPGGDPSADLNGDGQADHVIQQSYCVDPFFLYITGAYNQFCDMPSSGTSMASPHVAGTVALLLSQHPTLSPAQVRTVLEATARDRGAPGRDNEYGFGVIDARAAIAEVIANPPPVPPPGPPPNPRPVPQPGATSVTATTLGATSIRLNWTDAATSETGFRVDRSIDGGTTWVQAGTAPANAVMFTNYSLAPATTYSYRVRSYDAFGHSPWSEVVAATTASAPSAPENVTATALGASSIRVSWTDTSTTETGFKVERSLDGATFTNLSYAPSNATSLTIGSLAPGTQYWFRVRAYDGAIDGPNSAVANATTLEAPAAPEDLVATALSASSVRLTWTDVSTTEQGFRIERSVDSGATWVQAAVLLPNTTAWTVTTLASGTTYSFRVRGYDGMVNGPVSNVAVATTFGAPGAPANLTATALSATSIRLDWTDTSTGEQGFRIERSPDAGATWAQVAQLGPNAVTWTNTGLTPATAYWYRVRAFDGAINGAYSNVASATTVEPPAAPANLVAIPLTTTSIRLAWTDQSTTEQGFRIERSSDGGTWTQVGVALANATSYTAISLSPGTQYWFRVRAYEGTLNGEYSAEAMASTFAPPSAPVNVTVTPLNTTTVRVTWANTSPIQTLLKLERSLDGVTWAQIGILGATATSYTNYSLLPGTQYQFRIRASEGATNGPYSEVATGGPFSPPAAPGPVTVTVLSATSIRLNWVDNCSYETGYRVERSLDGVTWTQVGVLAANTTTYTNFALTAGTTYHYRVRAVESSTLGAYSDVVMVATP